MSGNKVILRIKPRNNINMQVLPPSLSLTDVERAENAANIAMSWAQDAESPDGENDTDSPTGKTQSSKSWALNAKNDALSAAASASAAATSETNAANSENKAQAWAESETSPDGESDSKSAKTWAGDSADSAELAQKWAESDESPDGETDSESPTSETMSAKEWALYAKEQASALAAYPVGTVYISTVNKSPATIFGGTWQELPAGHVLLVQGNSTWGINYIAGSTGGEATHTLTLDEMPTHTHNASANNAGNHSHTLNYGYDDNDAANSSVDSCWDVQKQISTSQAGTHSHTVTIENTGGGQAHNNMPPYLAVYMWKRTA